jgi:multiple sugar transport system permease protein
VLAFMSPWILGFSVFFGYPLVMSVYLSFTHYDLLSSPRWIGTANYRYLFHDDPQVWTAVKNTLWFIAVAVPLQVLFAFGIAMMLARARRGGGIFRTIFYLPALAPPVAATLGFVYILNPATGPVNVLLGHLGIQGPLWFHDPNWSKPALVALSLWGVGNTMVIFLAAVLFGVIQGLQYFTQAYVAAGVAAGQASQAADVTAVNLGYPQDSTLFYPVLLYQHGFTDFQMGYASAMSVLLLVVSFAITLVIVLNSRRWVYQAAPR